MPTIDPQLLAGLQQGLFVSLCVGLAFSAVWGAWLVVAPASAQRFAQLADRWVPTASWFERLNRPLETTRWFYRYHRQAGLLIAAGASYALWRGFTAYQHVATMGLLSRRLVSGGMDWLVPALEFIFVAFNAGSVIFGLIVVFRPSLLKRPERFANRWIDVGGDQALDRKYNPLANVVQGNPRLLGTLVAGICALLLWRLIPLS